MQGETSGSLLVCPFGLYSVLAMLARGATGHNLEQLESALKLKDDMAFGKVLESLESNKDFTLAVANKLLIDKSFHTKEKFQDILRKEFHARSASVNFQSKSIATIINKWVSKKTEDKIKKFIGPNTLSENTKMLLIDAVYFKAEWKSQFNKSFTSKSKFFTEKDRSVNVPMMNQTGRFKLAQLPELKARMLVLPYRGDRIVMEILLPDSRHGLEEVEELMGELNVSSMVEENQDNTLVMVSMPKFKLDNKIEFKSILKKLGMDEMFRGGFEDISSTGAMAVSNVIQNVVVEVDEEGSEAAAVTSVSMFFRSASVPKVEEPKEFIVDHPFVFFIRDTTTGVLLFQGRLYNPTE